MGRLPWRSNLPPLAKVTVEVKEVTKQHPKYLQTLPLLLLLAFILLATPDTAISTSKASVRPAPATPQLRGGCWLSGLSGSSMSQRILGTTGVPQLDAAFQREGLALVQTFQVAPWGYFLDDRGSPNAMASPDVSNPNGPDGTVVIGLTLLQAELARDRGVGLSVPAIMAHEFAHIVQFKRNVRLPTSKMELQADFLAGWYLGLRSRFIFTDVRPAFQSFFEKGDYAFNDPMHHGTPQQRLNAIASGLQASGLPFPQAYERSLEFARTQ